MKAKIGINGFGRIGRMVFRAALEDGGIEVVGINDLCPIETSAHLLKYDSVHGKFGGSVEIAGDKLKINGQAIPYKKENDPKQLGWGALGADIVIESTGFFRSREKAGLHLGGGAKVVVISAPADGEVDLTCVIGVNDQLLDGSQQVLSNASCTTNCLAPVVKALHDKFGVKRGLVTTIHSYTNDQSIVDTIHKDLRRARAAALNMIPTSTGAAKAIGLVMPELKGKLDGLAIRVPTPNVSLVDLVCEINTVLKKETAVQEVNAALQAAADGKMKGILGCTSDPVASTDFNHDSRSSIVDLGETKVIDGNFIKVLAWYDNEWGYACRCVDLAKILSEKLAVAV